MNTRLEYLWIVDLEIYPNFQLNEIFRKWRLRIIESGSGNADTLRLNDNGDMFIGEHNDAWNEHRQSFERLLSEIDQVSKELT
jgi:hypothetical protein